MFAYAGFERRVGELQTEITGNPSFSETYHWGAQERPERMRELIRANEKRISVPPDHVALIVKVLKQAISPSDLRNLLVHGDWWILHADGQIIKVRRDKLRRGQKRFEDIKIEEISSAANELVELEIELYKLQPKPPEVDLQCDATA
jgi:hypothetical protein